MIDKFLKKFCSDEVKILLNHMEEHFDDFKYGGSKKWRDLLDSGMEGNGYTTSIEKMLINKMWRKKSKESRRTSYLGRIVKQKIAPEELEQVEDIVTMNTQNRTVFNSGNQYQQQLNQLLASQQAQQSHLAQHQAQLAQQLQQAYSKTNP